MVFEKLRKLFDSPEWHQQYDGMEVIDVTDARSDIVDRATELSHDFGADTTTNAAKVVAADEGGAAATSASSDNKWVLLLGDAIDYYDRYDEPRQVREEAVRLFIKTADYIDGRMQANGRSLKRLVQKRRAGYYYYGDILGSIYRFAYGAVQSHYRDDTNGPRDYEYSSLSDDISVDVLKDVAKLSKLYVEKVSVADDETIRIYRLTPNGLSYRWWDPSGSLRRDGVFSAVDQAILQNSPHRSTVFWGIHPEVNTHIISRYLAVLRNLVASLDDAEYAWSNKQRRILQRVVKKQQYWVDYDELRLLAAILKLAEQATRQSVRYARPLSVVDEDVTVQRLVPKGLRDMVFATLTQPVEAPLSAEATHALRESYSQSWKVDAGLVAEGDYLEQFTYYQKSEKADKFMNEVLKLQASANMQLLALYYLRRDGPFKPARQKQLRAYVHPEQTTAFEQLVTKDCAPTASLVASLQALVMPPRRVVAIDADTVERVKRRHVATVSKLNDYLGEGGDIDDEGDAANTLVQPSAPVQAQTMADLFAVQAEAIHLEVYEVDFILLLLAHQSGLSLADAKVFAADRQRMLGAMMQALNQKVYGEIEDQLIVQSDGILTIEISYIEFAKRIATHEH